MPPHKVQLFLHQCLRTNILSSMLYEDVICQVLLISGQKFRKQVQISVYATAYTEMMRLVMCYTRDLLLRPKKLSQCKITFEVRKT